MGTKNNNDLFYTCSLIEYIGRQMKRTRKEVVDCLTKERIQRIYEFADVFHCEPIEKVADEFIQECLELLIMCRHAGIKYRIIGISGKFMNG